MILPKQEGTADTCVTKNEEEIFAYQDQHNLITLGWIHVCNMTFLRIAVIEYAFISDTSYTNSFPFKCWLAHSLSISDFDARSHRYSLCTKIWSVSKLHIFLEYLLIIIFRTGFFNLTAGYGLEFIANCRKTGFHPHPTDPPLFMVTTAKTLFITLIHSLFLFQNAEHIKIDKTAPLEVLDLRV